MIISQIIQQPEVVIIPANTQMAQTKTMQRQKKWLYIVGLVQIVEQISGYEAQLQLSSYEAQLQYYTDKIMTNQEWRMAGIFADEGITSTSDKKCPQFLKMVRECKKGKIDVILAKSISRFARIK